MSMQPRKLTAEPAAFKPKRLQGPVATLFSSTRTGSWRIVRPVADNAQCIACGQCRKFCPTDVIEISVANGDPGSRPGSPLAAESLSGEEKRTGSVTVDYFYCKGCGICANICPRKCIRMEAEPTEHQGESDARRSDPGHADQRGGPICPEKC